MTHNTNKPTMRNTVFFNLTIGIILGFVKLFVLLTDLSHISSFIHAKLVLDRGSPLMWIF